MPRAKRGKRADRVISHVTMRRQYYMTNRHNTVLYTGVTSNLARRVQEHRLGLKGRLASRSNITKLVYYEIFGPCHSNCQRKARKAGSRQKKIDRINGMNSEWRDLAEELWLLG